MQVGDPEFTDTEAYGENNKKQQNIILMEEGGYIDIHSNIFRRRGTAKIVARF